MKLRGLGPHSKEEFLAFMDAYCEAFDDLPDGAWQAACEEGVEAFNRVHETAVDTHDGWLVWITAQPK